MIFNFVISAKPLCDIMSSGDKGMDILRESLFCLEEYNYVFELITNQFLLSFSYTTVHTH